MEAKWKNWPSVSTRWKIWVYFWKEMLRINKSNLKAVDPCYPPLGERNWESLRGGGQELASMGYHFFGHFPM